MSVVLMVSFPVFVAYVHYAEYAVRYAKIQCTYPRQTTVNLDFDNLSLDNLCLFLDAHTNAPSEGLRKGLRLGHRQGKHFARGNHSEGDVRTKSLRHAYKTR